MLFNSLKFIIFFPAVVLMYFIMPKKLKMYWLLLCSYVFYAGWNAKYCALLMYSTVVTYLSGIALEKAKNSELEEKKKLKTKNLIVAASFVLNLAVLFFFKYINFAISSVQGLFSIFHVELGMPQFDIILPVGISFYVLQALSYTMDVYRDEIYAEKNFFRYALFVAFFPQLVAGPIERSKNLLRQLSEVKEFDYARVREGLIIMLWGYFAKMVIADRAAFLVNNVYANYENYYGLTIMLATALFAVQVYCDFMGYSIIAKGAAKVLGYDLMTNFKQPFFAQSTKDLWNRWHISLGSWLRDYLYFPMGGSRCSRPRKYFNLMVTFLASGLWHGAAWTYVLWGGLNGFFQIVEDMLSPLTKKLDATFNTKAFGWRAVRTFRTVFLFCVSVTFFRASTAAIGLQMLKQSFMFGLDSGVLGGNLFELGLNERNMAILVIALVALFIVGFMKEKKIDLVQWISSHNVFVRYAIYWFAVIMIVISLDITGQEFLYFQF